MMAEAGTLTTDQRGEGFPRVVNGRIDIGAFEGSLSSSPLYGNVNNDTTVDLTDAITALRVLAGISVTGLNPDADVNGDKKIGLEEVVYVLQKVAGLRN